jgi:very-short-patch-repair endonuclease
MKSYSINGIQLRNNYLELEYNPQLKERARALRKAGNLAEVMLWTQVNRGQFHGLDFDRQRIIGNYIVDFYIKALGLVIEIDGDRHEGNEELDELREKWLIGQGCRVIRFPSYLAKDYTGTVLRHLEEFILAHYV